MALDELLRHPATDYSIAIDESFPEKFANQLAQQEAFNKHLFRPNTYLHKWWARRCGSTFRTILKQFVPDPQRRDYYAPGGLEGKTVLDPMMGGGTTLHEAIRLGANVIGADIDPIPVVQARATLTQASLKDLQTDFAQFFDDLYHKVGEYFQTECPHCEQTLDAQYTLYG
ncbi:MAG: DNA methyltransferase, partial [Chloroflexota bacterium]